MRFALAIFLALAPHFAIADGHDEHSDHLSVMEGLRALHAWTRATDQETALVFVELENIGDHPITLEGGMSDIAEKTELVGFQLKGGEGVYSAIPMVPIAPGSELVLKPEALALRMSGLEHALAKGDTFEAELRFDTGHLKVHVAVEAANAHQHSHAGHNH
ncbi:copper chaperone PCu(A)C [Tropicimonas marinistellae]|uniref:copper chaperone PCu(A)C n=1 Tax=Tropicimonas marinistellae TaxID=1739787 RepID=UPI00082B56D1|nr:copper chaperone PCu(A)C [Tropicimonas marinistellae]